jgi:hypothetical protein
MACDGCTISSNSKAAYDGESHQWDAPYGLLIGKVTKTGGQLVQFRAGPHNYVADADAGPQDWGFRFNLALLSERNALPSMIRRQPISS